MFFMKEITALAIQALIIYVSIKLFMNNKKIFFKEALVLLLFLINNSVVHTSLGIYTIVSQLFFLFIIIRMYEKDWKLDLIILSTVLIINILGDHIASLLISFFLKLHLFDSLSENMIPFLILYTVITISIILITRSFSIHFSDVIKSNSIKNLFAFGATSILLLFYLNVLFELISGNNRTIIELNLLFFIILILVSLVSVHSYIDSLKRTYEIEKKETEVRTIRKYTSDLEYQYLEMRKFRHDYQNILTSLEGYFAKNDYDALETYFFTNIKPTGLQIEQYNFELEDISRLHLDDIKSILTAKIILAQEKKMNVSVEIQEKIDFINIPHISLVRILGILLDNAIEALEELPNGLLQVAFIKQKNSILIVIQNTCKTSIPKIYQLKKQGFSTKGDNRGLGLTNLQELIDACPQCTSETLIADSTFIQKIIIHNKT